MKRRSYLVYSTFIFICESCLPLFNILIGYIYETFETLICLFGITLSENGIYGWFTTFLLYWCESIGDSKVGDIFQDTMGTLLAVALIKKYNVVWRLNELKGHYHNTMRFFTVLFLILCNLFIMLEYYVYGILICYGGVIYMAIALIVYSMCYYFDYNFVIDFIKEKKMTNDDLMQIHYFWLSLMFMFLVLSLPGIIEIIPTYFIVVPLEILFLIFHSFNNNINK